MSRNYGIQSEYIKKSFKTTPEEEEENKETPEEDVIKIDTNKYGTGKPKRTIIRAKITHG